MKKMMIFLLLMSNIFLEANKYNSIIIDSAIENHKIEIFYETSMLSYNTKLLVFLHGVTKGNGIHDISRSWFDHYLNKGYAIAAISMPGYGNSTGKKDFCGPFTLATLHQAIECIKNKLNAAKFGIIGFGQGAIAGMLLATQRKDFAFLVSANGCYDLGRHKQADDKLINSIKKDYHLDVDDDQSIKYRSPILHIDSINTPVFLLHRKNNPIVCEEEVRDFYHKMIQKHKDCQLVMRDKGPEDDAMILSQQETVLAIDNWLDQHMQI